MTAASMGRQTRGLVRGLTAHLTGKAERGPDWADGRRRVPRRNSLDVNDHRAQVFRPIGDGSRCSMWPIGGSGQSLRGGCR